MCFKFISNIAVCTSLSIGGVAVTAQETRDAASAPPPSAPAPSRAQRTSDLLRAPVLLRSGEAAGHVTDLVVDSRGNVSYVVAEIEGLKYLVPYRAMTFDRSGRTAWINLTPERFDEVAFYSGPRLPDLSSALVRQEVLAPFIFAPADAWAEHDLAPVPVKQPAAIGNVDPVRTREVRGQPLTTSRAEEIIDIIEAPVPNPPPKNPGTPPRSVPRANSTGEYGAGNRTLGGTGGTSGGGGAAPGAR
jgi:hypothetical protein